MHKRVRIILAFDHLVRVADGGRCASCALSASLVERTEISRHDRGLSSFYFHLFSRHFRLYFQSHGYAARSSGQNVRALSAIPFIRSDLFLRGLPVSNLRADPRNPSASRRARSFSCRYFRRSSSGSFASALRRIALVGAFRSKKRRLGSRFIKKIVGYIKKSYEKWALFTGFAP